MNILIFYFAGVLIKCSSSIIPSDDIKKLYKDLLSDYDTHVRPVRDQNETINVYAIMSPYYIQEVDTALQKYTFTTHLTFTWTDEFLQWNLSKSHGIDVLQFRRKEIWHPSFAVSVAYNGQLIIGNDDETLDVSNTGRVSWSTKSVLSLIFDVDIRYYPFDTQECTLDLYMTGVSSKEVLNVFEAGSELTIATLPEWNLLNTKSVVVYNHHVNYLRYGFLLRRRPSFIIYTTITPLILLAFLNSVVFLVPIESGEKGSIAITFLLAFCVYISSMSAQLPQNSDQSYLLLFMTMMEGNSAIALFYTMLQSMVKDRGYSLTQVFRKINSRVRFKGKSIDIEPKEDPNIASCITKEDCVFVENSNTQTNAYRVADTVMFCLSLIMIVVTIAVFAGKVRSSFRNAIN